MDDKEKILELYKVAVGTITANEHRRQNVSQIFGGIVAAGFALLGASEKLDPLYIAIPATVICLIWYASIDYFRRLASAKFKIIEEMESHFPMQPFMQEWRIFKGLESKESRNWERPHISLSTLELVVPAVGLIVCVAYILYRAVLVILQNEIFTC